MELSSTQFADVIVAAPAGRIDHQSAAQLESALAPLIQRMSAAKAALVLDFGSVEYISSVGLRVLMIASRQLRVAGAKLAISNLQPLCAEIFKISRFDLVLDVFPSVAQALKRVSPAASKAFAASHPSTEP